MFKWILAVSIGAIIMMAQQQVAANGADDNKEASAAGSLSSRLSEADTYIDLNTGKQFKVIYDGLNDIYNRDDLFSFDLFVNTRTRDTMWLDDAIVVNGALIRGEDGKYRLDPMKVKRDGDSYRVKL